MAALQIQSEYTVHDCLAEVAKAFGTAGETFVYTSEPADKRLDFTGRLTCPLQRSFRDGMEEILKKYYLSTGMRLNCYLPTASSAKGIYQNLWKTENIDEFPNAVVFETVDDLFRRQFLDRFVSPGYFEAYREPEIPEVFTACGIPDPEGHFTVLAANPMVILVDHQKLGSLPVPKNWEDIIKPVYRNQIIIGGIKGGGVNANVLLYVYKEYGYEGLNSLALNIKDLWMHPQIGKWAGTSEESGAGLYIMPWAIAMSCVRRGNTSIVWPKEGAWTQLTYLLVKKSKIKALSPVVGYFTGPKFGNLLARNLFPPLNGRVKRRFPEGARLKWLGWDYIRSNDVGGLKQVIIERFFQELGKKQS